MDRKIRAFLAIVDEGTITGAANRIGLAQPSLTKFLQRLETELGARLFERKTRGIELTTFGEKFLVRARRIEAEYRFAFEEIAAMKHGGLPVLRIGAGPLYHMLHVPNALQTLMQEFPGTRINVVADNNRVTIPMLQRGELDLVCGELEPGLNLYGMERVELMIADFAVIMRPDHPHARNAMTPEALAGHTWVIFQHDVRALDELPRFLGHGRFTYQVALSTSSFATALRLVAVTDYLMLAPAQLRSVIEEAGLIIRQPTETIRRFPTGVTMRTSSANIPIIKRLVSLLKLSTATPDTTSN